MKIHINIILIYLVACYSLNAQTNMAGNEQYNSYEYCIYVDNLYQKLVPEIFNSTYYFRLKESKLKVDSQVIDTIHQKRNIYIYSKKAKDGYRFVNKKIMEKIEELNYDFNVLKLTYIYEDKIVSTEYDVSQILRIKKKSIQISIILQDENAGLIYVYISNK